MSNGWFLLPGNLQKVLQDTIFTEYISKMPIVPPIVFASGGAKVSRHPVYKHHTISQKDFTDMMHPLLIHAPYNSAYKNC